MHVRYRVAGGILLALAALCAGLAKVVDRFGYELCHRGLPLETLVLAIPALGLGGAIAALFLKPGPTLALAQLMAAAANGYYLVLALIVINGVGMAPCA